MPAAVHLMCGKICSGKSYYVNQIKDTIGAVVIICIGLSAVVLLLNFLSVTWPQFVGDGLYGLLVVISTPMICGQYWLISLFLWACLLMVCLKYLRKTK